MSCMINILKTLLGKLSILFLPASLLLSNNPSLINGSPAPQPTIYIVTPSPTPTNTPTPTLTIAPPPSPTSKPKPTTTPKPSPTPLPTRVPVTNQQLEDWFTGYSNNYSVDKEKLKKIAYCESKFNANAVNGDYAGLFQFSKNTWEITRRQMNLDNNPNLRFNAEESIKTAAFKISAGGISAWKNCAQ